MPAYTVFSANMQVVHVSLLHNVEQNGADTITVKGGENKVTDLCNSLVVILHLLLHLLHLVHHLVEVEQLLTHLFLLSNKASTTSATTDENLGALTQLCNSELTLKPYVAL